MYNSYISRVAKAGFTYGPQYSIYFIETEGVGGGGGGVGGLGGGGVGCGVWVGGVNIRNEGP